MSLSRKQLNNDVRLERERHARKSARKEHSKLFALAGGGIIAVIVINLVLLAAAIAVVVLVLKAFGVL